MEILLWIAFFVVGILAGIVGGLLGLSGGVVTIPCLVLLLNLIDFPQTFLMHTAMGTSLAAMVLTGIATTWAHAKQKGVVWDIVVAMVPGLIMGCLLGAFVAHFLSGIILKMIFGAFLCLIGAAMLLKKDKRKQTARPDKTLYTWIGLGIGGLSSLLGLGGGILIVPLLLSYRYSEKQSIGTAAASGTLISLLAAIAFMYFGLNEVNLEGSIGYVYLPAFIAIGFGTVIFAPIGTKLAHQATGKKLRRIFAAVLIMIGILMVF